MISSKVVYLSLGGNIGDRKKMLEQALVLIAALPEVKNFQASSLYETSPMYLTEQSNYLNAVCRFQTEVDHKSLFKTLQIIEKSLGKESKLKNYPRVIDIDFLFFGKELIQEGNLEIPHPRWRERLFVIVPLLDLTPTINLSSKEGIIETIDLYKLKDSIKDPSQRIKKIEHCEEICNKFQ